jgi:DNA-binding Xre family transcriptional regulator
MWFRMSDYSSSCISIENASSIQQPHGIGMHEIKDIDILQQFGINASDISKLKSGGINTIRGLKMTTRKKLAEIKGISDGKVKD